MVSESDTKDENEGVYRKTMGTIWSRLKKIEHDNAVLAWIYSVRPDVRRYVKANYTKKHHTDVVERTALKLLAHRLDLSIAALLNTC